MLDAILERVARTTSSFLINVSLPDCSITRSLKIRPSIPIKSVPSTKSVMVSLPSPARITNVSVPLPPVKVSVPAPPSNVSSPLLPISTSSPAWP